MNNFIGEKDFENIIKDKFACGAKVTVTPTGNSMKPMLDGEKDYIILDKNPFVLKKYDLPLYKRDDEKLVIHRVISINSDGTYNMCGDNQFEIEKGIRPEQVLAVVKAFTHNGKIVSCTNLIYKFYCRLWIGSRGFRKSFSILKKVKKELEESGDSYAKN